MLTALKPFRVATIITIIVIISIIIIIIISVHAGNCKAKLRTVHEHAKMF